LQIERTEIITKIARLQPLCITWWFLPSDALSIKLLIKLAQLMNSNLHKQTTIITRTCTTSVKVLHNNNNYCIYCMQNCCKVKIVWITTWIDSQRFDDPICFKLLCLLTKFWSLQSDAHVSLRLYCNKLHDAFKEMSYDYMCPFTKHFRLIIWTCYLLVVSNQK